MLETSHCRSHRRSLRLLRLDWLQVMSQTGRFGWWEVHGENVDGGRLDQPGVRVVRHRGRVGEMEAGSGVRAQHVGGDAGG